VLIALLILSLVLFVVLPFVGATLVSLLWALLVGLMLGLIARVIAPGNTKMGLVSTSLVGLAGSLLGTAAGRVVDASGLGRLLLQIAAAVALVLVFRRGESL
jgi:uncharacterized membrane protein YeaQ/YmgE (transglycosylase-associated protein family)